MQKDDGYGITNGPAMSPDGRTLYHNSTLEKIVYAFDHKDGAVSNKRVFAAIAEGYCDGPSVDSAGVVHVGLFGGWGVDRYAPDGRRLDKIRFPCSAVTKAAFGDADLEGSLLHHGVEGSGRRNTQDPALRRRAVPRARRHAGPAAESAQAVILLEADGWRLELLPEIGGAIGRLAFLGLDVLRPAALDVSDPLETACFPLVPFANRVANGRFTFDGQRVSLPVLDRFHPHALHGEAWLEPWTVVAAGDRSATLQFRSGGGWPWPYMSRQTITLHRHQATVGLELTNASATVMPAGLGLHPYFLTGPDARLTFTAEAAWLGQAGAIPERLGAPAELFDFSSSPARASVPFIDHCYAGWRGVASIEDGSRTVAISATPNASWAHVYSPEGQGFWCFEPVTHRPDALNAPKVETSGVAMLRPGETMAMRMTIAVSFACGSWGRMRVHGSSAT